MPVPCLVTASEPLIIPDALWVIAPGAFNTKVPAAESEIPALMAILFDALNVSVFVLAHAIALATVILPACVPLAPVCTITLAVPNAVCKSFTVNIELSTSLVYVLGDEVNVAVVLPEDCMVKSLGSNNNVPVIPRGARKSTLPWKLNN